MSSIALRNLSINFLRKNQKYLLLLIKLFITSGLFFYIFSFLDFNEILSAAANANYYFLTFAFLLSFLNLFFQYWKWKTVCNSLLDEKDKSKILFSLFYGFSAGVFTPGRIGEYFGRGIAFKDKSPFKITAATFVDKVFPLFIVIFFGLISFIIYLNYFNFAEYGITIPLAAVYILFLFIIVYFFPKEKIRDFLKEHDGKVINKLKQIIINLNSLKKLNRKINIKLLTISFLFYACFLIQFALLFSAFSQDLSFLKYLWVASLVMFVKTFLPVFSIGEFGVREGTAIYFLLKMGGYASTAFNASILLFVINLLFPALTGLFFLYKKKQ